MRTAILLLAPILCGTTARHVGTASYPEITILERTVVIDVRAEALLFADYLDFGVGRGASLTRDALLAHAAAVGDLARRSIRVALNGAEAPLASEAVDLVPAERAGPGRFRVRLVARGADPIREVAIDYGLFREHDPAHRGYATIHHAADEMSYVFARGIPFRWRLTDGAAATLPRARAWLAFLLDGIEHILSGADHILFLFGLVLAATSASAVAKTVTGFTLAHSLTLGLGAAGVVHLPRLPIEVAIALSIAWVGAANLWERRRQARAGAGGPGAGTASPARRGARWPVTIFFGLVHGLGFSEALAGAEMPAGTFAAALALFNCGVECGQLMLLLLVLPPLAWLRDRLPRAHAVVVVRGGSLAIIGIGVAWAACRVVDA